MQLGLVGCGGDDLLLPSAGQPAKISVVSGDRQTGTVGQPLGEPIVVVVTDPENRPVEGIEVAFVVPPGATIAPNDTVATGADGRATVNYTLSTSSGDQVVEARAKPVVPSSSLTTTFTATAMPEAAVALVLAGGDAQRGEVSTALADSLAVRAVDRFGNGVAGVEVTWEAVGGSVSAASVVTGADGRSAVERILADQPGTYGTTAAASGLDGSPVSFTATAIAAPSPALVLVTQPSSTASAGVPFAQQPELQLQDPSGAPLNRADVRVTVGIANGGGSLGGGTSARSDASGRVRFDDLSIRGEPGTRTLIFAAEGFSPTISSPIVVAPGPPSPERSSATVPDGTAGAATSISISLEDEFGTRVEGAAGSITVTVTGANQVAALPVTDQGNGSYSASYTPTHAGTDQVDVRVNGNRLDDSPFTSNVVPGPASPATTTAEITTTGILFTRVDVIVTTRDAQGNLIGKGGDVVEVQLNGANIGAIDDNGDGTYSTSFITFGSVETIGITLNGQPIAGSPFRP
ncbi:MAG TPA: filamin/ABP280 repeat domain-containing protein [Gemmatimonadales bacterium]|nr:filamin/ABP280 repeat domain-containing protein [Gemmatimonadales bacterium]